MDESLRNWIHKLVDEKCKDCDKPYDGKSTGTLQYLGYTKFRIKMDCIKCNFF